MLSLIVLLVMVTNPSLEIPPAPGPVAEFPLIVVPSIVSWPLLAIPPVSGATFRVTELESIVAVP